jgi:Tic22-like family
MSRLRHLGIFQLAAIVSTAVHVSLVGAFLDDIASSPVAKQSRRLLNFGSIFGSATRASPYERIGGHPVFQVTTPWGSPYMNMERLTDTDEALDPGNAKSRGAGQEDYRSVVLFFLDPDDALAVHGEMSQMENMAQADIRITASSLAKAVRQSTHLGNGMLTGYPVDPVTGNIKQPKDGGSLRYKIVPPKRQLYYAARCKGRERVGLLSESPNADAEACLLGNAALNQLNLQRRREKRETNIPKKKSIMQLANAHMDGYTGVPVFFAPEMHRTIPKLKKLISGVSRETPLFFNYEDLEDAWSKMRKQASKSGKRMPEKPTDVEVFNLWDVMTSMEREMWNNKNKLSFQDKAISAVRNRLMTPKEDPGLESITFIPSSRSINYKQAITARGNGKARLRPMKQWGYQAK